MIGSRARSFSLVLYRRTSLGPFFMPRYLIQNRLGEFLTADARWTLDKACAGAFSEIRALVKTCQREQLSDAYMIIDLCDVAHSSISIPVKDLSSSITSDPPGRRSRQIRPAKKSPIGN